MSKLRAQFKHHSKTNRTKDLDTRYLWSHRSISLISISKITRGTLLAGRFFAVIRLLSIIWVYGRQRVHIVRRIEVRQQIVCWCKNLVERRRKKTITNPWPSWAVSVTAYAVTTTICSPEIRDWSAIGYTAVSTKAVPEKRKSVRDNADWYYG